MFSRILNRIGEATNKSPSSTSPQLSPNQRASEDGLDTSTEGFLCPSCMVGFPSIETLQNHYEISHVHVVNGRTEESTQSSDEWTPHHVDLQQSSKEGQQSFYGSKKELKPVPNGSLGTEKQSSQVTLEYYINQIQILEENNSMVLSEVVMLKQQLEESKLDREVLQKEKSKLEQKAALLAGDLASVQSCLDEVRSENEVFRSELSENKNEIQRLTSEIHQRLGAEDAVVLRQELISVQKMMDTLTLQSESEKESIMDKCRILEEEKMCLQKELENCMQPATPPVDKMQLDTLLHDINMATQELAKKTLQVFKYKETCTSLQGELAQKNSLLEEKSSEAFILLELQQDLSNQITELNMDKQKFEFLISEKQREIEELGKELASVTEHCTSLETQNEELHHQVLEGNSTVNDFQHKLEERENQVCKFESECCKFKETVQRLEAERKELFIQIDAGDGAKTAISQLQDENALLIEQILQLKQLNTATSDEAQKHHDILTEQLKESNSQCSMLVSKESKLTNELQETRTLLEETKTRAETYLQELNTKNEKLMESEKNNSVLKTNCENKHHQFMMANSALGKLAADLTRTQNELKELNVRIQEEQENNQKLRDQNSNEIKNMALEKQSLSELLEKCKTDLGVLERTYEKKESDWNKTLTAMDTNFKEVELKLQEEMKAHKAERILLEERERALEETVKCISQEMLAVKLSLEASQDQVRKVTIELDEAMAERQSFLIMKQIKEEMGARLLQLETEYAQLCQTNDNISAQKVKQEHELQAHCKTEQDLRDQILTLEQKNSELLQEFEAERVLAHKVLSEVMISKENVIAEKKEMQEECGKLRDELDGVKVLCQNELKNSNSIVVDLEQKLQDSFTELEKLQQSNCELENKLEEERSKHDAQVCIHQENQATLKQDLCQQLDKVEELHLKLTDVSGQRLELEAKLENALDERRALLERFIVIEEECDKLRKETGDLRNKAYDTLAALHELGRENQTLQIENSKLHQRKWTQDSEVTHCTSCKKLFTVTVRKHHCRSCGSIFCKECSAKTATLASYRKPVRVCESCFEEVGG